MQSAATLLFASSNPHKVEEVRAILAPLGLSILGLNDLPPRDVPPEPEETGDTFAANARIKAVAYARASNRLTLADDSGLAVDALHGAPGVHSARYARDQVGPAFDALPRAARDKANNARLIDALKSIPSERRTARFICAMCLVDPAGRVLAETQGEFPGVIIDTPRGSNGFGYDPLLYLPDARCTSAELPPDEKNRRSHRGHAARAMADALRRLSLDLKSR